MISSPRRFDDLLGGRQPVLLGLGFRLRAVDRLVRGDDRGHVDRHQFHAGQLLDLFGRAGRGGSRRRADQQNARLPHADRHAQQRDGPIDVREVAGCRQHDAFALLLHRRHVHPVMPTERLRKDGYRQSGIDELEERLCVAEAQMHQQDRIRIAECRGDLARLRVHVANQLSADERHISEPLGDAREILLELADFGRGIELGLRPGTAGAQVDDVDLHRRQRRPAALFGRLRRTGRQTACQQQAASRGRAEKLTSCYAASHCW